MQTEQIWGILASKHTDIRKDRNIYKVGGYDETAQGHARQMAEGMA